MSLSTDPSTENLDSLESTEINPAPDGPEAAPAQREASAAELEDESSLPIPAGPLRSQLTLPKDDGKRPSLWKRLRMRSRAETAAGGQPRDVATRLEAVEQGLGRVDATIQERFEALNARFEEVWESEEQLSHLADIQDKLDRLAQSHLELTTSIGSLRRSIYGLAVLVVLAAGASGLIYGSLF